MQKKILITGITGQDGSYLAEYLLSQDHIVHGIIRRASTFNTSRIDHLYRDPHANNVRLHLHYGDITDTSSLTNLIQEIQPDEIYNFAAQSHVKVSFELPVYTSQVTALGVVCILEAIRRSDIETRFYQASSSEMFGSSPPPQNEGTSFQPRSPYAISKVFAYWSTISYRESYGMPTYNGILFNHESPRRGETFVTRKITRALARIVVGKEKKLYLGNLTAKRDWGYAPEYVMGMVKIIEYPKAEDFVLGTGTSYMVKDFLSFASEYIGLNWEEYVEIDERYLRPAEVDILEADPSKAKKLLNWHPKILAPELAKIMMDYDMLKIGLEPPGEGIEILEKNGFSWIREPVESMMD